MANGTKRLGDSVSFLSQMVDTPQVERLHQQTRRKATFKKGLVGDKLVAAAGLEPATFGSQSRRSTN